MRTRIALMVCSYASLRDDRQMARQPASNVQRQKETLWKPVCEANAARPFLSQAEMVCAGAVFLVALVVYSWTLAPTVTLTDSGELIVAAYGLGVAHPPGTPLWVMLAHLASLVPVVNVAERINFSSAVFRCACLRNAYSRRGRINCYGFLFCRTSPEEQGCAAGHQH